MSADRILIDTGAIYAFMTRTDRHHAAARRFVLDGSVFAFDDHFLQMAALERKP